MAVWSLFDFMSEEVRVRVLDLKGAVTGVLLMTEIFVKRRLQSDVC